MASADASLNLYQSIVGIITLYMPVHSFSMGISHSDEGRSFRAPDKVENSLFIPFSALYLFYVVYVLNKYQTFLNKNNKSIVFAFTDSFNSVIQTFFRMFQVEFLLTDNALHFLKQNSISTQDNNLIIPIVLFYIVFILAFPFWAGVMANNIIFGRNYVVKSFKIIYNNLIGLFQLKINTRTSRFFLFFKISCKSFFYLLLTFTFYRLTCVILIFWLLQRFNLLKSFLKFFSSESLPNNLESVYNPNQTAIVDITLSDKKMISGILSNIIFNKTGEALSALILEHPLRKERLEKFKIVNPQNQKDIQSILLCSDFKIEKKLEAPKNPKKIPCNSFYVPASTIQDMNIYCVPHEIHFFIYGICTPAHTTKLAETLVQQFQMQHTTQYIFSDVHIYYNGDIQSILEPLFINQEIIFKNIQYQNLPPELIKYFNRVISSSCNNIFDIHFS